MLPQKAPKIASAAAAPPVEGRDHISSLPEGVLQHILSFLPAKDAVRTCVLAKRWRHTWKSTTALRFVCDGSMKEIQDLVEQLLRLRVSEGTPLDMCEFRLSQLDEDDRSRTNFWIRIALQCKVRVLHLMCSGIPPMDHHPLFISQYLKKLQLRGFDDDVLPSKLLDFSWCPNLEDLEIDECKLVALLLISSQSLKRLTITFGCFSEERRLPICAPNLVSLWIEVVAGRTPSLQRMPSLLTACVKIFGGDYNSLDSDYDNNQCILLESL